MNSRMYLLYSLALALATIISFPWWGLQMLRLGKYRAGLRERLGIVPQRIRGEARPGSIWIHAVSVGEVLAVGQLVAELQQMNPETRLFISTTTAAGQRLARERFGEGRVFYLPLDFGFAIRSYLRLLQPRLLLLAETELWPNLLHLGKASGASVAIVNARISDRSFPRYRRFHRLFAGVLAEVDLFLAQTEEDRARLLSIGARTGGVQVSGNLKFDIRLSADSPLVEDLRRVIGKDFPVLVCGSTTEGEEELLLAAFQQVVAEYPAAVMVLAPRRPERFDQVATLITGMGMNCVRRTTWDDSPLSGKVFLLDSVGELAAVYGLAHVAFVGGSLFPVGGHNILEPAQHGVAVLTGPHTFNFREIVRIFEEGGGLAIATPETLALKLLDLIRTPERRIVLGQRASALFHRHTGATMRTLKALRPFLTNNARPQ
jgi:3-deoxy-D-manno-octulosonic-acid transferase